MGREFFRFLMVGTINTLFSWLLFVVLVRFIPYIVAYTLAYASGIVSSYFLNVRFVFRERVSLSSFLKFPLTYMLQYAMGMLIMWLLVGKLSVEPELAMIMVVLATIPVTFLASRKALKTTPANSG